MPPLCAILLLFCKVCGLLGNIIQPNALVRAQLGENVTLPCFYSANEATSFVSWLKLSLGQKPQLVAIIMKSTLDAIPKLKVSARLSAKAAKGTFNLTVSQIEPSDSAMYFCATSYWKEMSIGDGATLMVKGSESHSRIVVLQQPKAESERPGDSVTLQCTVHTDAGTYYCAVATGGEMLVGNGTKLNIEGNEVLYSLAGALTLSVILNVVLALKRRKGSEDGQGAASISEVPREDLTSKQCQDAAMHYGNLTFSKPEVRRNKREVEKETVYSNMRFRDHE